MEKLKPLLLNFVLPTAISIAFAVIFKWGAAEIVWGIWGASLWLSLIFCFFVLVLIAPYLNAGDGKAIGGLMLFLLIIFVFFHDYTGGLIIRSGINSIEDNTISADFAYKVTKMFFPFIILYVYGEIKNIFFKNLDTWQQFVKFFIVFSRLQVIALVCYFSRKYIPDILLYVLVYAVCFFPITIFEYTAEELEEEEKLEEIEEKINPPQNPSAE